MRESLAAHWVQYLHKTSGHLRLPLMCCVGLYDPGLRNKHVQLPTTSRGINFARYNQVRDVGAFPRKLLAKALQIKALLF